MSDTVVVVGGGPAAAAAALVLARADRSVIVLDGGSSRTARAGETLPAAALPLLRDLGILDAFHAQKYLPCAGSVSAWGSPVPHVTDAIANPLGHGWQIERSSFDSMLRSQAQDAGATVLRAVLRSVQRSSADWLVETDDGSMLRADWLIDATGRRRAVARRCGVAVKRVDHLIAFQAHVEQGEASDCETRTLVESVPDGWWYTSRVPKRGRIVAFLTDRDVATRELLNTNAFRRKLDKTIHVGGLLNEYAWSGVRVHGADASSSRIGRVVGDRWLAVGDAAMSFDPLSSQGVFNALCTGVEAGHALTAALAGDDTQLDLYAARIESVHHAYMQHRTSFYGAEARWPEQIFWSRRSAGRRALAAAWEF